MATSLTEMVMVYDMDRKLIFVNPAVESLTGYSTRELERANFICWIHPDDQGRMLALWDDLFLGKPYRDQEYRLVTKDGRHKWALSSWTPILDESGRQVGVQGREWDITAGSWRRRRSGIRRRRCGPTKTGIGRCSRTRPSPCGRRISRR